LVIADPKLVNETVEWMVTEVKRRRRLDHHEAAEAILERVGLQASTGRLIMVVQEHDDRDGSIREVYRFTPSVLQAFRELTGKTVKWGKHDRYGSQSTGKWVGAPEWLRIGPACEHHMWLSAGRRIIDIGTAAT
jgi:hypothetical protein